MRTRLALTTVLLAGSALLAGCDLHDHERSPAEAASGVAVQAGTPAYDRDYFGGWTDVDQDGCNSREEVLTRDSGAGDCPPKAGRAVTITDPYAGQAVTGRKEIDVDHVVSLRDAWDSGAWSWTQDRRVEFANDEYNLLATSDDVNRAKSDLDPSGWRPADPDAWCLYARIYRDTKQVHGLLVTVGQDAALNDMCPAGGG